MADSTQSTQPTHASQPTPPAQGPLTHSPRTSFHLSQPSFTSSRSSHGSFSSTASHPPSAEELINAYEADQERIVNVLSRKLEQLSQEKVDLENAMEAENEAHVLRLQRELAALRAQQLAQGTSAPASAEGSEPISPVEGPALLAVKDGKERPGRDENATPGPSMQAVVDALRRENDGLRNRLHETETDYIRLSRTLSAYKDELVTLRRQLGIPVDNLVSPPLSPLGLSPRSRTGSLSGRSWHGSPVTTSLPVGGPSTSVGPGNGISNTHSPNMEMNEMDILSPPLHPVYPHPLGRSQSLTFPYPLSYPIPGPHSNGTPSSPSNPSTSTTSTNSTPSPYASLLSSLPQSFSPSSSPLANSPGPGAASWGLSYPLVPPPSLSSSLGSGPASLGSLASFPAGAYGPASRRGSLTGGHAHPLTHTPLHTQAGMSGAAERGRRVVETGSLRRESLREGSRGRLGRRLEDVGEVGDGESAVVD
ncbi:hypothetical protein DACRYDRAFT_110132 [Dacryopinax primogenitus]|uniref:Uncharacterized protein n=1 Tax=Dacryopinax primogenitus (strain DJM 731) TaxID=1858805 RepID=M5FV13_DACPD|nr:uncharacterized protein DACRYDRAFT_110132 [Dacryopinax primogenitus]EJT99409.1 hypothetical protein DACRYDRAFT_110132 [Dacryopinax primogenitus]